MCTLYKKIGFNVKNTVKKFLIIFIVKNQISYKFKTNDKIKFYHSTNNYNKSQCFSPPHSLT